MVAVLHCPNEMRRVPWTYNSEGPEVPHQVRGFLGNFSMLCAHTPCFTNCSACSDHVVEAYVSHGKSFIESVCNPHGGTEYLSEICGITSLALEVHEIDFDVSDEEDF